MILRALCVGMQTECMRGPQKQSIGYKAKCGVYERNEKMKTSKVTVKFEGGQEARPIALLVQEAGKFDSKIYLELDNKKVNAKSIMGMMSLGLKGGDEIQVSADGSDEDKALKSVCGFLEGEN